MSDKDDVNTDLIRELAEILDSTGLTEIEVGRDDWHVRVARESTTVAATVAAPVTAPVAVAASPAPVGGAAPDHPGTLSSPMVGVSYMASDPDSDPYVKVGDTVSEGDTVMIIEAMKVFNDIKAPRSGKVTRIFVGNGSPVEFGEPLMVIE